MGIIKPFDIKRLRPFRKGGAQLPDPEHVEEKMRGVDSDLKPDEQNYVRHYLGYADVLLDQGAGAKEEQTEPESENNNVIELPNRRNNAA